MARPKLGAGVITLPTSTPSDTDSDGNRRRRRRRRKGRHDKRSHRTRLGQKHGDQNIKQRKAPVSKESGVSSSEAEEASD